MRAKKKTALANMIIREIGFGKTIKMTGRKKAPGLRMKDWWEEDEGESARTASLEKPTAWSRALYPPRHCVRASYCHPQAPVLCGRAFHRSVDKLLVDGEPQTLGCSAQPDRGLSWYPKSHGAAGFFCAKDGSRSLM